MPLFFIIPIVAGGLTLGATAVDVTQDMRAEQNMRTAQAQQVVFNPSAYSTVADCQAAAAHFGVALSACNR